MRILAITDGSPYPPISGEGVRNFNLLRRIAEKHEVWLAAIVYSRDEAESILRMNEFCKGVEIAEYEFRHPIAHLPELFEYAINRRPLELVFHHSEELVKKIQRLASSIEFDVVQIEHSYNARYVEALPSEIECRKLLVFHNIVFDQYAQISRIEWRPLMKLRALLYSRMMRRWEPNYAQRFDNCIALSNADRELLKAANPHLQIEVVPNGTDTQHNKPLPRQATISSLLFVGTMNYTANVDGVVFFCQDILPRIRESAAGTEMWIVGKDPVPEVRHLNGNGVHVTGKADDLEKYYRQATVTVVPLRAGSGTRLKILESMALGRPVVSTSVGCEGLEVVDSKHLLIADDPSQFAKKTLQLLDDKDLYDYIVTNARQLVEDVYDWDVIAEKQIRILAAIVD